MPRMRYEALKRRRTKIVATLGPATSSAATIGGLLDAGADALRLNFSHATPQVHSENFRLARQAAAERGTPVAVLVDLSGPKLRVGRFAGGEIELTEDEPVTVTTRDVQGGPGLIPSGHPTLAEEVQPGSRILLTDGLMELKVNQVDGPDVKCTVVRGGCLADRQGMNLPDVTVTGPVLTERDREHIEVALELGVDLIAMSFVRTADDVAELRALLPADGPRIIAKIERAEAVDAIDSILEVADALMVARGDLGVELAPEVVPVVQAELISAARTAGKPVIVATQMLESMREHRLPTRAEVSDVSTAVTSGADAVMLSAETASGRYPIESVQMMDRIARRIEGHLWAESGFQLITSHEQATLGLHDAVARAIAQLSRDVRVHAIVAFTESGGTAATISAARATAPLIAVSSNDAISRQMNLLWGVLPVVVPADLDSSPTGLAECARALVAERDLASAGQHVLVASGFGTRDDPGNPTITVLQVPD